MLCCLSRCGTVPCALRGTGGTGRHRQRRAQCVERRVAAQCLAEIVPKLRILRQRIVRQVQDLQASVGAQGDGQQVRKLWPQLIDGHIQPLQAQCVIRQGHWHAEAGVS